MAPRVIELGPDVGEGVVAATEAKPDLELDCSRNRLVVVVAVSGIGASEEASRLDQMSERIHASEHPLAAPVCATVVALLVEDRRSPLCVDDSWAVGAALLLHHG